MCLVLLLSLITGSRVQVCNQYGTKFYFGFGCINKVIIIIIIILKVN